MFKSVLAVDLGSSTCRFILGWMENNTLCSLEVYRFDNPVYYKNRHSFWDYQKQVQHIITGLSLVAKEKKFKIMSMAVDSWGVDYVWIDKNGDLVCDSLTYRDKNLPAAQVKLLKKISKNELYRLTGIPAHHINSLNKIYYELHNRKEVYKKANKILFIADLFNYFLCGNMYNEITAASTSQILSVNKNSYCEDILEKMKINKALFPSVITQGKCVGYLKEEISKKVKIANIPIVSISSHDTACAVYATPMKHSGVFLSCGTWSLIGVERSSPITSIEAQKRGFSNERGEGKTYLFLKNILGLYLIQRFKKELSQDRKYLELEILARKSNFTEAVDCANIALLDEKRNIKQTIIADFKKCKKKEPLTEGDFVRAIYLGLIKTYIQTISEIELITNNKIKSICLVGGGVHAKLLCEILSAKWDGLLYVGPAEATAVGNILQQLKYFKCIKGKKDARDLVDKSFNPIVYKKGKILYGK